MCVISCFICFPREEIFRSRIIGNCPVITDCNVSYVHLIHKNCCTHYLDHGGWLFFALVDYTLHTTNWLPPCPPSACIVDEKGQENNRISHMKYGKINCNTWAIGCVESNIIQGTRTAILLSAIICVARHGNRAAVGCRIILNHWVVTQDRAWEVGVWKYISIK